MYVSDMLWLNIYTEYLIMLGFFFPQRPVFPDWNFYFLYCAKYWVFGYQIPYPSTTEIYVVIYLYLCSYKVYILSYLYS